MVRWPKPEPLALWAGHYSVLALWVAVGMTIASEVLRVPAMSTAVAVAWIAAGVAWWCDRWQHREHLCERCIGAVPLDPAAAVEARRAILRAYHADAAVAIAMIIVVACQVPLLLARVTGHSPSWSYASEAVAVLVIGASSAVTWQHRRLRPWCPWCHWGDGGDVELSPGIPDVPVAR